MKKLFNFYYLTITIIVLFLFSCSTNKSDEIPTPTKPNVEITQNNKENFKPAIYNIGLNTSKNKNAKILNRKKLVKTIQFDRTGIYSDPNNLFKINISLTDYLALPTDNIYDPTEEFLNVGITKTFQERLYYYDNFDNLIKITIDNISNPIYNTLPVGAPILFEYNLNGIKNQITQYRDNNTIYNLVYNNNNQIIKALNVDTGNIEYTFEYDEYNNIKSKYLYSSFNNKPQMRYTYEYYPNNTYRKNWISVDYNGVEVVTATILYTYDKNISGVYNNEPIYKILRDNQEGLQYLHIVSNSAEFRPKYFYDSDGYLKKYDSLGRNNAEDITLFFYE